jgi:hypothetical protein
VITTPPAAVVCQVRRLLESIGDALVTHRLEPLLTAEQELEAALQALSATGRSTLDDESTAAVRAEAARCRVALERCRRLGASLEGFAALMLQTAGHTGIYGRAGEAPKPAPAGTLQARV